MTTVPPALLAELNAPQSQAVSTLSGPLLVVAGPGSGKTRVLTHRIAALVATGTAPSQILAVTFTNKAAAEMRERVAALVGADKVQRMWVATFHAACVRILRTHHLGAGLPRSFTIVDQADSVKLISQVIANHPQSAGAPAEERRRLVKTVARLISTAKNNDVSADQLATAPHPDAPFAASVMVGYAAALRTRGAVDFDDLLLLVAHLLRDNPAVVEHYRRQFTHVLVDEFQDTNAVQWEITRHLVARNVCVVGDADQSIYAFRGANPRVLTAFTGAFPDAAIVRLDTNYRSTGNIVAASHAIIEKNPAEHRAAMSTVNPAGAPVQVVSLPTDLHEARWVADQIALRGGPLSSHAVLVRTNAQTRVLESILRERGVAHDVVGTVRFFDRAEVKDALAYLRLVINPVDLLAFERAAGVPRRGLGPAVIDQVTGQVQNSRAIPDVLADLAAAGGRSAAAAGRFLGAWDKVRAATSVGVVAALEEVLDGAGLVGYFRERQEVERVDNLRELVRSAGDFVAGRAGTDPQGRVVASLDPVEQVEAFLEFAALMSSSEKAHEDRVQAVQVATMHAAKGKEWENVYVVGVEEGICPHARSTTPVEVQEERRLLFVAMSRAKRELALTYAASRRVFGQDAPAEASRFLLDLPSTVRFVTSAPPRPVGLPGESVPAARAPAPAPVGAPGGLAESELTIGRRVAHATFGTGTVVTCGGGVVAVRFAAGVKALSVAHARLRPV